MLVLFSYARIGECACVVSEKLVSVLSVSEPLRAIPIVEPREIYTIGLVPRAGSQFRRSRGRSPPKQAGCRCPKKKDLDVSPLIGFHVMAAGIDRDFQ